MAGGGATYPANVSSLAFSTDGKVLVSSGGDNRLRSWGVPSGSRFKVRKGDSPFWDIAFSSINDAVYSASKHITAWDLDEDTPSKHYVKYRDGYFWSVDCSNDGKYVAGGHTNGHVIVWDAATGDISHNFDACPVGRYGIRWVHDICFNTANTMLASASSDGYVRVWNLAD
jgi:WD40 repeat protein